MQPPITHTCDTDASRVNKLCAPGKFIHPFKTSMSLYHCKHYMHLNTSISINKYMHNNAKQCIYVVLRYIYVYIYAKIRYRLFLCSMNCWTLAWPQSQRIVWAQPPASKLIRSTKWRGANQFHGVWRWEFIFVIFACVKHITTTAIMIKEMIFIMYKYIWAFFSPFYCCATDKKAFTSIAFPSISKLQHFCLVTIIRKCIGLNNWTH